MNLFIDDIFQSESTGRMTSVTIESRASLEATETLKIGFSDPQMSLAIPPSKTTKIRIEGDHFTTNTFYYAGSHWSYPPGELQVTATGVDILGSNTSNPLEPQTLEKITLAQAFKTILGSKIQYEIEPALKTKEVTLQPDGKTKGQLIEELAKMFGITPIARDGKILFIKNNSPLRKVYTVTPKDITSIQWADNRAKIPSGVSVPYLDPYHYTQHHVTVGNKSSAIKIADIQQSREAALQLANSLYREHQAKQYNIRIELAETRPDIKAGSKLIVSGVKNLVDNTYILTHVSTHISIKNSSTILEGNFLV